MQGQSALSASSAVSHVELHADERTLRGLRMAAAANTWRKLSNGAFGVPSASEPGVIYTVTPERCTCVDSSERGNVCKHRLAVAVYLAFSALVNDSVD